MTATGCDVAFSDAHMHLTEEWPAGGYPGLDSASLLLSCTATVGEWDRLSMLDDPRVVRFYGVHPWYCEEQWTEDARTDLERRLSADPWAGVGEIGLDSKRGDVSAQMPAFIEQLETASRMGRVVQVHMVGCEREVLASVRGHGGGCRGIIIHGFKGPVGYIRPFVEAGCHLSIGPRILRKSDAHVRDIVGSIPSDRLLLESDAPHQGRDFLGMEWFAGMLSSSTGIPAEDILSSSAENTRRLVHG